MSKVYFSSLWGWKSDEKEVVELYKGLREVAKKYNGVCYTDDCNVRMFISFDKVENRRAFNKEVQQARKKLNVTIDTCETKSVESYFGENCNYKVI